MRHAGQVREHGLSADVLAHDDRNLVAVAREVIVSDELTQEHGFALVARDFNAHDGLAGDRSKDTHALGRECHRQVVCHVGDARELDARSGLELIERDDGARAHGFDRALDAEVEELLEELVGILEELLLVDLGLVLGRLLEELERGKLPVALLSRTGDAGPLGSLGADHRDIGSGSDLRLCSTGGELVMWKDLRRTGERSRLPFVCERSGGQFLEDVRRIRVHHGACGSGLEDLWLGKGKLDPRSLGDLDLARRAGGFESDDRNFFLFWGFGCRVAVLVAFILDRDSIGLGALELAGFAGLTHLDPCVLGLVGECFKHSGHSRAC